ncbi:MAG: flagellar assembly protein FliW [Elusimicrobiota bacterium]
MADLFANLVFQKEDIIFFNNGIPGFDNYKRYVLASVEEQKPFEWLICVDNKDIRFVVINPLLFKSDYDPKIDKSQIEDLEIKGKDDLLIFVIVTLAKKILESTANLMGPLFINVKKKVGKQIIVDDERYCTRERIIKDEE